MRFLKHLYACLGQFCHNSVHTYKYINIEKSETIAVADRLKDCD